ncbi:FtsK/SpoIIIE family protein [Haloactinopolyspora alba]|uniref:FtsK/SpoIIIE family protein n=1 Tax=Haloactinopolyspora alba TaxID=648780 RepID=A0A2P8DVU7_9ACTN|nr:FtsK/SpoIIIE domain-containing protein [Haloactinopolyspora alba]PSL01358.1 FtsK/SpoIIIE family protein [Haloactinopolyspora alba]
MRLSALRAGRRAGTGPDDPPARLAHAVDTTDHAAEQLRVLAARAAERERRRFAEQQQTLTRDAERRHARTNALLAAATDRARLDITELLGHGPGYAHQPWDAAVWEEPYDEPVEPPRVVHVATLGLASPNSIVELPFVLPALGANVVITHTPAGRAPAHNLAQGFVTRALAAAPPGSLRAHLLDAGGLGQNLGILSRLPEPLVSGGVRATHDEIAAELTTLREHVHRLNSRVLLGDGDSLVSRWHDGSAQGVPCTLVFAAGLDGSLHTDDAQQLWSLARTGNRCGVAVVAVIDTGRDLPQGVSLSDLTSTAEHVHVDDDGGASWESAPPALHHHTRVRCPNPPGTRQHRFLATVLAPAAARGSNRPVRLTELLQSEPPESASTTTTVSAPVGLGADGTPIELAVGDDEDVPIGGLLVGPSGSGKTTLLHAFIHALVHRYPPDELELHLLDMKAGVEFAEYAPRPGSPALPHVRTVGIEADATFALGVLHHLRSVDARRKQLFKDASAAFGQEIKNIAEYREVTGARLPRVLLIADEFQLMLAGPTEDEAWSSLDVLAKQGRSQGIHLLLATQSLNSVGQGRGLQKASVFDQLELRLGLRCKPDELSTLLDRTVRDRLDTGRRGSGVLNRSHGDRDADQLFQAGLLEPDERRSIRADIDARHLAGPRPIRVSRGASAVELADVADTLTAATTPSIYVGAPVGVDPPLVGVPAHPGGGRGLLLSDRDESRAVNSVAAILAGLALQPGCRDARFVVLDLLPETVPARRPLDRVVELLGERVTTVTEKDAGTLPDVAADHGGAAFVAVLGLQYSDLEVPFYAATDEPHPLSWLCSDAPARSVFPLIWLDTPDRLRSLGPDGERLQLRADAGTDVVDTATFLGRRPPFAAARGRMWFHDLAGDTDPRLVDPLTVGTHLPELLDGALR